jgi:hypothetical protein
MGTPPLLEREDDLDAGEDPNGISPKVRVRPRVKRKRIVPGVV